MAKWTYAIDFDIKYQTGRSNGDAETVSHNPQTNEENNSEEYDMVFYTIVCDSLKILVQALCCHLTLNRLCRMEVSIVIHNSEMWFHAAWWYCGFPEKCVTRDNETSSRRGCGNQQSNALCETAKKYKLAQVHKTMSRPVCRYLLQFNWLVFHQGVLDKICAQNGPSYH